ncbi:MAG: hypothetical protein HRU20_28855 [Pseudomonadales bacterium]|nr:hypothetical protein [Pseudomonadales bacterium]
MATIHKTPLAYTSPIITQQLFSDHCGLRKDQIRGQAERENVLIYKLGRFSMVNVTWYIPEDKHVLLCPVMTKAYFAIACGLKEHQVETQIIEGNLPSQRIGRLVMVDIAELTKRCLEQKQERENQLLNEANA